MTTPSERDAPETDDRDPAKIIPDAVQEVTRLAATWLAWDGIGRYGDGNVWTPHKALRRVNDHLLDHLAEIEAVLAGVPSIPDTWHGRTLTLDSDWARFTEADLDEWSSRLNRFASLYRIRVGALSSAALDLPRPDSWTIRQIIHHVSNVVYYAHQLGDLTAGTVPV
ncbi:MAG: hypothetical protein ACR2KJ_01280 [Jatrophihabitans sp.]